MKFKCVAICITVCYLVMSLCSRDFFVTPLYDILLYVNIGKFLRLNIFAVFEDYIAHNRKNLATYLHIKFYSDSKCLKYNRHPQKLIYKILKCSILENFLIYVSLTCIVPDFCLFLHRVTTHCRRACHSIDMMSSKLFGFYEFLG